jgi:hypothetical protein
VFPDTPGNLYPFSTVKLIQRLPVQLLLTRKQDP